MLVPLTLRNLEQLGHIKEKLTFLVFSKVMPLVEQENTFVENADALLLF